MGELIDRMLAHSRENQKFRADVRHATKRAEIEFTADVRCGDVQVTGATINEAHGRHECFDCGEHRRVWWVSRWVPAVAGALFGHVSYSPRYCVSCMWRRMSPREEG